MTVEGIAWIVGHPVLYIAGIYSARQSVLGKWKRRLDTPSEILSFVFAICALGMLFFVRGSSRSVWYIFMALGPLCCLFTGLSYGLTWEKERLLPLALVSFAFLAVLLCAVVVGGTS